MWEYKVACDWNHDSEGNPIGGEMYLNTMGADGWELVSVLYHKEFDTDDRGYTFVANEGFMYFFKRQIR